MFTRSNPDMSHAQASSELLNDPVFQKASRSESSANAVQLPTTEVVENLRAFATARLGTIIEWRSSGNAKGDHNQSDLAAAKDLLGRLYQPIN